MSRDEGKPESVSVLVLLREDVPDVDEIHREATRQLERAGVTFEFLYLVGSGCPESLRRARAIQEADRKRVRIIEFAGSVGESAMLGAGAERARSDVLLTLPSRFEAQLEVIGDLCDAIREGADLVVASRRSSRGDSAARAQSALFNRLVSVAAGVPFRDIASGTRAARRSVFEEIPLYGDYHRYLPLLAHRAGFRIQEIPATPHPRATGPAVHPLRVYLWRAIDLPSIFFVSRFTRHPLRLFGGVGSGFAGAGGLLLLILGIQRLLGTPLADRPALVLAVLLLGLGVQAFTIGLLGELILFFHARTLRDYRIAAIYESDPPPLPDSSPGRPEPSSWSSP